MNIEIWQKLLPLESLDITQQWFRDIHSRGLSARRAREINAASKQAREFFRSASTSLYSVRPLLTFYGVTCLGRALSLLLKKSGGEETLTPSHGLETVSWKNTMRGDPVAALKSLCDLRIRTTAGLFSDFVEHTNNRISVHVSSSAVDWSLSYEIPKTGIELTIQDLFSRSPDLQTEFLNVSGTGRYASVSQLIYTDSRFEAKVATEPFRSFLHSYAGKGYTVNLVKDWSSLRSAREDFAKNLPQLTHTYLHKTFGSIPSLYIAEPFPGGIRYSQLCVTYMTSYVLGMLVRYYPTHWVSLSQGGKGDSLWPTINRAQQMVEHSFPELVSEMITDILKK